MSALSFTSSDSCLMRAQLSVRFCFVQYASESDVSHVANATALLPETMHDPHTSNELEMVLSSWMEDFAMTRSITDTSFPYVLLCSTFGAIVSLASVWLVTALTYAPALVA
jgi:hypothetical protein